MNTSNYTSSSSFPSLAILISLYFPSVSHWILFPLPFLLPFISFYNNSSNFLLPISSYLCILPNFYCTYSAFSLFFPNSLMLFLFSSNLCITLLHSFDLNTFSNPRGLTFFLRPFWLSIRPVVPSQHWTKAINPIHAGTWLRTDETSASTSFASPSFLINSRTADDVNHYRNHPSPIPPLRCFFKNCHQSSSPWHKLSRQTPLTLPLNYFPYFRPIRSDSHQFSVLFSSKPSLNQLKHLSSSRIIGGNNNSCYCFEC